MDGSNVPAIVLNVRWTVWLLVALLLLRGPLRRIWWVLLLGFAVLALLLELTTGLSWRVYLMAWLGAHAVLAAAVAVARAAERRLQASAGLASLAGLGLLWVQGGAGDWQYVTWSVACVVCLGAGFGLCWATVLRAEQRKTTVLNDRLRRADDTYQQQSQTVLTAERQLQQAARDSRAERGKRRAAEDELTSLRADYNRVRQEAAELRAELGRVRGELGGLRSLLRDSAGPAVRPAGGDSDAGPRRESTGAGEPGSAPQASAVKLSFFLVPEPGPSPAAAPGARVRLGIERTVVSVPEGRLVAVSAPPAPPSPGEQRSAGAEGPLSRIRSAAAASLATELTKPLDPGDRWLSADSYAAPDIAGALDQVSGWLHQLIAEPAQHLAPHIGLSAPAGSVIGTVAAQAVFRPLTAPMAKAARCCEIAGIVIGMAAGVHPVAALCVKMLAHDEFSKILARDLTGLIEAPGWKIDSPHVPGFREPSMPEVKERSAAVPEGPEVKDAPDGLEALEGPGAVPDGLEALEGPAAVPEGPEMKDVPDVPDALEGPGAVGEGFGGL